jgi:hypothetical protein
MFVGFKHRRHDNNLEDYLIARATGSNWIHTELIFNEGISVSSWAKYQGVTCRLTKDTVRYPQYWELYYVGDFDVLPMINFLNSQMRKGYDWQSIMWTYALPFRLQNKERWTCSELVYYALAHYSPITISQISPETPTPGQIRQLLIQAGYPRITN